MILTAALLAAASPPEAYSLQCQRTHCQITSSYLEFEVRRSGRSVFIRPSRLKPEVNRRSSSDWIDAAQYQVVPDFCFVSKERCHFLFGPRIDVTKWDQRKDAAYQVSTREALKQLGRAETLRISVTCGHSDVVNICTRTVSARPFFAAIAEADARLRSASR